MQSTNLSVFKPVAKHCYSVEYNCDNYSNDYVVGRTPTLEEEVVVEKVEKSPKPIRNVVVQRKTKKFWSIEQKKFAVEKAKLFGLSRATKYLQINIPQIYGDLSPSTLQYWIQKSNSQNLLN